MYPLFAYPHVLIRQYGDSVIYRWTDISMEYEPVNKTGAEFWNYVTGQKALSK